MPLAVAVLGLGEAGGTIASGLAAAGCVVRGWDPAVAAPPSDVERTETPTDAVAGAELVLSLTTAAHAVDAAASVAPSLAEAQVYADLNTTAPSLMSEVAAVIMPTRRGVRRRGAPRARADVGDRDAGARVGRRCRAVRRAPSAVRDARRDRGRRAGRRGGVEASPQCVHEGSRRIRARKRRRGEAARRGRLAPPTDRGRRR